MFYTFAITSIMLITFNIFSGRSLIAAEKVDMANFLEEGVTLTKQKKDTEDKLEKIVLEKRKQEAEVDKYNQDKGVFNLDQQAYAAKCLPSHTEYLADWCAKEFARLKPMKKNLDDRMTTINDRSEQLDTEGTRLADQYAHIKQQFQSWELRRKLLKFRSDIQVEIDKCFTHQPSMTDKPEAIVLAYKMCWEQAGSAPALYIPDPSGLDDPMVVKPGQTHGKLRTSEEAIKEFQGKPIPGPNTLKTKEPPPPSTTR